MGAKKGLQFEFKKLEKWKQLYVRLTENYWKRN